MKMPLRYYGSKWRIAPLIIDQMPPHTCYVEPFGGGMSVLLRKEPAEHEVYNDIDGEVVNFFRVLRDAHEELLTKIYLTPHSREELALSFIYHDDPVERARRFYVRKWQGRGHATKNTGWRFQHSKNFYSVARNFGDVSKLMDTIERLKCVQIERDDAFKVVPRFDKPHTLFYIDPPYPKSTRYCKDVYAREFEPDDHGRLADLLQGIQGMAIVSTYRCDLYDELYSSWDRIEKEVPTQGDKRGKEVLYISPNCLQAKFEHVERERIEQEKIDYPIFGLMGGAS